MAGALGIITEQDVAVPMRDGVILRGNIFRPDAGGAFPGLLLRTPYGKPAGGMERYVRAGYAVVTQDSRGRYASEGEYVPFTVQGTGDAEDGFDTVEWLAGQPWCDGKVGTMGASYNAWMQWELARLRPPHLCAMAAYSIPLELTEVDWWGAFKPGRRIKWWLTSMAPDLRRRAGMLPPHTPAEARQLWDELGHGHWLGYLPWQDFPRHLPPPLRDYAEAWLQRPDAEPWQFSRIHGQVNVPNLDFSGWYDHCGGTMQHLELMQRNGGSVQAREQTRLIIGPWSHSGLGRRQIGDVDFGPQAELDLPDLIIRWFDHWLKGVDNGTTAAPVVRYFVMGSGRWEEADTWPPAGTVVREFHLSSGDRARIRDDDGMLQEAKAGSGGPDRFQYDPGDPVPTLWTPAFFTVPADRRKLSHREDILCYRTEPLERPIQVVGHPEVVLFAASTAPDTDFFARLVDEFPDGPALEVCYGMVRARYRNGTANEALLVPGQVTEFHIRLGPTANWFAPGHRLRLDITSSDFPNHDRNHNTGRNDLQDTVLQVAVQSLYHSPEFPTRLRVPTKDDG